MNSRSLRRARARNRLHAFTRRLLMITVAITAVWIVALHDQGNASNRDYAGSVFEQTSSTDELTNTY